MDALDKLRSKLPPEGIKERYGVEITCGQVSVPVLFVETHSHFGVQNTDSVVAKDPRCSTLEPDVEPLTRDQAHLLKAYLDRVKTTRLLRGHVRFTLFFQICNLTGASQKLDEIDQDLEDFKHTVSTQAVAELTNYRGINDWGEVR